MNDEELRAMLEAATDGPWEQWRRSEFVNTADGEPVCQTQAETPDASYADARLIAAAPDLAAEVLRLRETLKWIANPSYVGDYGPEEVVEIHRKWAQNALAKPGKRADPSPDWPGYEC